MANVAGMKKASSIYSFGMNGLDRLHELHERSVSRQFLRKAGKILRRFHNVYSKSLSCYSVPWRHIVPVFLGFCNPSRVSISKIPYPSIPDASRCISGIDPISGYLGMMYCCIYDFHRRRDNKVSLESLLFPVLPGELAAFGCIYQFWEARFLVSAYH